MYVSAISVWEVAMLDSKGRIRLSGDGSEWVREALSAPGVQLLPLSPDIAVASSRLPGTFHGDPADRILAASARLMTLTLVTRDERMLAYAAAHYVTVLAPHPLGHRACAPKRPAGPGGLSACAGSP